MGASHDLPDRLLANRNGRGLAAIGRCGGLVLAGHLHRAAGHLDHARAAIADHGHGTQHLDQFGHIIGWDEEAAGGANAGHQ
jgi:hypothetical protein